MGSARPDSKNDGGGGALGVRWGLASQRRREREWVGQSLLGQRTVGAESITERAQVHVLHGDLDVTVNITDTVARDEVGRANVRPASHQGCNLVEGLLPALVVANRDALDRQLLRAEQRAADVAGGAAAEHLANHQFGPVERLAARTRRRQARRCRWALGTGGGRAPVGRLGRWRPGAALLHVRVGVSQRKRADRPHPHRRRRAARGPEPAGVARRTVGALLHVAVPGDDEVSDDEAARLGQLVDRRRQARRLLLVGRADHQRAQVYHLLSHLQR
eukprot:scaffold3972_cov95-Isochrysis_galbana.AAC.5